MLSSPGIGSGLDVTSIVTQLMQVERQPLQRLDSRRVVLDAELSGFGRLKSAVDALRSAMDKLDGTDKFRVYAATSSNKDALTATAGSTAAKGTYRIDVSRIAENHRMAGATVYADSSTTVIGTLGDTMTLSVGGGAFTVDYGGKTLAQIRDAINDHASNAGVTASILKDDAGYRLTLTANETGATSLLSASYSGSDPFALATLNADRNGDATFTAADLNALIRIENQFDVTSDSNTVDDAIEGVTLSLVAAGTTTLTVDRDKNGVEQSVKSFVDAYNALRTTMSALGSTALSGDRSSLTAIESQLRGVLNTPSEDGGTFSLLFEVGISTAKDGSLQIDSNVLRGALDDDFDAVAQLFGDSQSGFAVRLGALADDLLSAGGLIDSREESYGRQLRQIEDRRLSLERRLQSIEAKYFAQFSALDGLVSQLNATSSFLTQQLSLLRGQQTQS